jgi:uncharacterized membrane protein
MKTTPSLEEIKQARVPLRNVSVVHKEKLSMLERCALWITDHIGTMGFFLIIFFWTIGWITWNILAVEEYRFDPYPAFVLWIFISNTIQLFLLPLILVGQNLQNKHAEVRAQADFEVNTKAEREIEVILAHLENQDEILQEIVQKISRS